MGSDQYKLRGMPAPPLGRALGAVLLVGCALMLAGDRRSPTLAPAEEQIVRQIIATIPIVARDRYDRYSGLFSWNLPSLPTCDQHWGLPLSSLDPFGAVFFKAIYAGRSANATAVALREALAAKSAADGASELFCDPLTWRGYIGDLSYKRPAATEYGTGVASTILKHEILANRTGGYVSAALRLELAAELDRLRGALTESERARVAHVRLLFDPTLPLSAIADRANSTVTLSDALVQYVFVRQAIEREDALKRIIFQFEKGRDLRLVADEINGLADQTVEAVGRNLAFIIAHELAHIFVPTIDEREADCYGLAVVTETFNTPEIGVFGDVQTALVQGHAEYWNGLPASVVNQRFALIKIWSRQGVHIRQLCMAAWKWLEAQ
jgi:hypothetical protein